MHVRYKTIKAPKSEVVEGEGFGSRLNLVTATALDTVFFKNENRNMEKK